MNAGPSPGAISFSKVEGLGNDFVLLDGRSLPVDATDAWVTRMQALAPRICDRRRGVGADGLLLIGAPKSHHAAASMVVVNHDGSRPEMCGNGLRCAALVVAGRPSRLIIDTGHGPLVCEVVTADAEGRTGMVRVDMGTAQDRGLVSPAAADGRSMRHVTIGNPHAIAFVEPEDDAEYLARTLGPAIEVDPAFLPARTNVEFVQVTGPQRLLAWVWERGCGITHACGTGACAVAFAAQREGRVHSASPIAVTLPGGELEIQLPPTADGPITMLGPARIVYEGRIDPSTSG